MKHTSRVAVALTIAVMALFMAPEAGAKGKKPNPGVDPARPHAPAGVKWTGEIVSITPEKIIIKGNKGTECEFAVNTETKFGKDKALVVNDFKKGDKIVVICAEENGRRTARQVMGVNTLHKKTVNSAKSP